MLYLHVTLVPFIDSAGELKTKPTQHSVNELRRIGIHPDIVVCRSRDALSPDIRDKIALFADVEPEAVIVERGRRRRLPRAGGAAGARARRRSSASKLGLAATAGRPRRVGRADRPHRASATATVEIALVGKYVKLHDAYLSVHEALKHAGIHHGCARPACAGSTPRACRSRRPQARAREVDGVLVPGGFGSRGWEGKILACRVARERGIPYLGICLGMHVAVSEFARHVVGLEGANSTEMDPETPYPVIDLLPEQKEVEDLGGTMRLGAQAVELADGTRARETYGEPVVHERHRHRYEVNNHFRPRLVDAGLVVSGTFQEGRLVEIVELPDHPWFVASQFHPEFKSRPTRPGAALPRLRRRRARPRARARGRVAVTSRASADAEHRAVAHATSLDLFLELAAIPSPPGEERAVADRVAAYLRDLGLEVDEDDAGPRDRLDDGEPLRRARADATAGTPIFLCAHLDTVPPERADRAGRRGRRRPQRRRDDPRRRQQGGRRGDARGGAARARGEPARTPGIELLFTPKEEVGLRGAYAFDHTRLRARVGYVYDQAAPIGEVDPRRAVSPCDRGRVPRPGGARGHVPGGGPLGDRRRRARDRRPAARPDRRGDDRERRR